MNQCKISNLFNLEHTLAKEYLSSYEYPWDALKGIKDLIETLGPTLPKEEYNNPSEGVYIHKTATIAPTAYIGAPTIIGPNTEVRHCAYIRGSALIGANCVVGNSVEVKNAILFDNVQTPHFNYVGDSILGYKSHMGAGSVTSNVKSDKSLVTINKAPTNLKKCGAFLGDNVEVGCNAVLNPGTVVGKNSSIYPTTCVRGVIPPNTIIKNTGVMVTKE